jgi:uncharacterized protein YjbJ (UPF0337 family)
VGAGTGDHSVEARGARHRGSGNFKSRWAAFGNWLQWVLPASLTLPGAISPLDLPYPHILSKHSGGGSRIKGQSKSSAGGFTGNYSARSKGNMKNLKGDLKVRTESYLTHDVHGEMRLIVFYLSANNESLNMAPHTMSPFKHWRGCMAALIFLEWDRTWYAIWLLITLRNLLLVTQCK